MDGAIDDRRSLIVSLAEVEDEVFALLRHGQAAAEDLVAPLDVAAVLPHAVRQFAQTRADALLGVVDDVGHRRLHGVEAEFVEGFDQTVAHHLRGRDLGAQIEREQMRQPRIAQIDALDVAAELAVLNELHRRDQRLFGEDAVGVDLRLAGGGAADVDDVQRRAGPAGELALPVHRAGDHHAGLVRHRNVRVVGEEGVVHADTRIVGIFRDQRLHERRQRRRLRADEGVDIDEIAFGGHQAGVHVEHLGRHRRTRQAADGARALVIDVPEPVPQDLESLRIEPQAVIGDRGRNGILDDLVHDCSATEGGSSDTCDFGSMAASPSRCSNTSRRTPSRWRCMASSAARESPCRIAS